MELANLTGIHILSGIETGTRRETFWGHEEEVDYIKFTLDGTTYLAVEDAYDGYRSYMAELKIVDEKCKVKLPDIQVFCKMKEDDEWKKFDILEFFDMMNGKKILAIGTGNTDDYYPYCNFEYYPENMFCNERGNN